MSFEDVGTKDIEVLREDQMKINQFSRLNSEYADLSEEIEMAKKELQTLVDAEEEVQCCLEADGLLFRLGESFIPVDDMEAGERIEASRTKVETKLSTMTDRIETVKTEMDSLKKELYDKFGNSINLES
ncbi:unnamed protein product [Amoebophrya sp. A25]|nr:unnamed protein product [Amoebophrya sp. A25]|eukprot:GSA25T00012371001.1